MGSLIYDDNVMMKYNDKDKHSITDFCNLMNINYFLDDKDIIIFPPLFNKTFIIKTSSKYESELIEPLKNQLSKQGAKVVSDNGLNNNSLNYIEANLLIYFSIKERKNDLTVYIPFINNEDSFKVAKQLIKNIVFMKKNITYKIANIWSKIKRVKYWKYLFSKSNPTIIIELSKSNLSNNNLNDFIDILNKSIIMNLGKIPCKDVSNSFISNLISYESKLSKKEELIENEKQNNINKKNNKVNKNNTNTNKSNDIKKINKRKKKHSSLINTKSGYLIKYPGDGPSYVFKRQNIIDDKENSRYFKPNNKNK